MEEQRYYIGWRSLLTGVEGRIGATTFTKADIDRLIADLNEEYAGVIQHFSIPADGPQETVVRTDDRG